MSPELAKRIEALAADRVSGSSEILVRAIEILRDAFHRGIDLDEAARAVAEAQPAMAALWNASAAALAARDDPQRLDRFAQRVARAPQAIARFTEEILETGARRDEPIRVVTLSYSATVAHALEALARRRPIAVACAEGRPALEGRHMASRLAGAGASVAFFTDAAIGDALAGAAAVVVGADAVSADWFINKIGTRMLAACAGQQGVPVYVLAGREKFVDAALAGTLQLRQGATAEVWPDPPAGVRVENPTFELTSLALVSGVITDVGILQPEGVAEVCRNI